MPAMRFETYVQQIQTFYRQHRRMPSYREIGAVTGLRSTNAVFKVVHKMIQQGLLAKDARGRLIPKHLLRELRFVGLVEAGFPSPADDELFETMNLEQYLVRKPEATYLLRVRGDSMVDAGILPGDLVLVERGAEPHDGEIVIAQIDGEWTLKYFRREGNKVYLQPANGRFQPFYPKEELTIAAVVKAVIRKY
jgi:SOS regulatory protein LexA